MHHVGAPNELTQTDTVTLDSETARLLLQNASVSVLDRTHARADLLNLTDITEARLSAGQYRLCATSITRFRAQIAWAAP